MPGNKKAQRDIIPLYLQTVGLAEGLSGTVKQHDLPLPPEGDDLIICIELEVKTWSEFDMFALR